VFICDIISEAKSREYKEEVGEIYLSFSEDDGNTWSELMNTDCYGIVPDRILELSSDLMLMGSHFKNRKTGKLQQVLYRSYDGGKTWGDMTVIASDEIHDFCEGSIIRLGDGTLACYMRENSMIKYPSFTSFSYDNGKSWSEAQEIPIIGDRPVAGQLPDGDILITYRNVGGMPGTYVWKGGTRERGYQVNAIRLNDAGTELTPEGLKIDNKSGESFTEYFLHPLESLESEITFSARLKCSSNECNGCAIRAGFVLRIYPDGVMINWISERDVASFLIEYHLDGDEFHNYELTSQGNRVKLEVDGETVIDRTFECERGKNSRIVSFGNLKVDEPSRKTYDIDNGGLSYWQRVKVKINNKLEPDFEYFWSAEEEIMPDDYEQKRIFRIDDEASGHWWDTGYSGWVRLDDGDIFCVYYKRGEARKPYIVGARLEVFD